MITTINRVTIHHHKQLTGSFSCDENSKISLGNFQVRNTVLLTIVTTFAADFNVQTGLTTTGVDE